MAVPNDPVANGVIPVDLWFPLTSGFVSARTVPAHIRAPAGWGDDWGNLAPWRWPTYVPIVCPVCGFPNLAAHEVVPHGEVVRVLIWTSCDLVMLDGVWQRFYNDPCIVMCAIHRECAGVYSNTAVLGG